MNLSEIGVSGVILVVILAFAAFVFAKGTLKILYGFLCFAGTLCAGWAGYTYAYPILAGNWPDIPEHSEYACALAAAIFSFFLLKTLTDFVANPFAKDSEQKKGSGILGLLTGFTLGIALSLVVMHKLIDKGTKAEIDYWISQISDASAGELPKITKLKYDILSSPIGTQISNIILSDTSASQTLSKLVIMQVVAPEKVALLAQDPSLAKTLEHPKVKDFLHSPEIKQRIENGDTSSLVSHPAFIALVDDPELNHAISQIDIEQALKLR